MFLLDFEDLVQLVALLFGGATLGAILKLRLENRNPGPPKPSSLSPFAFLLLGSSVGVGATSGITLGGLFWGFLKIGSLLYGSGYVLLAFLRSEFVRTGWLTERQLLDPIAVGQFTPGPLFSSATFVGYLIAGVPGAALATMAIFGPAFGFVGLTGSLVPRLRENPWTSALLDGVNAAAIGLMIGVTLELGRAALVDALTLALALLALVILVRFKINSAWLVMAGALIGWFSSIVR